MNSLCKACEILDNAEAVHSRYNDACNVTCGKFRLQGLEGGLAVLLCNAAELYPVESGICLDYPADIRKKGVRKENPGLLLGAGHSHEHCLGGRCRAVIHRGVGNLHTGELADHALILEDVAESSLGNLGLVRSVGRAEL